MLAITQSSRRLAVACKASSSSKSENPKFEKSKKVFNDFHNKRNETFKLNSNDLVKVSQGEINDIKAFIKELDTFHRQQFDELKAGLKKKSTKKADGSQDNEEVVAEVVAEVVVETDDNIFLKK
jgi:hypothetical protein